MNIERKDTGPADQDRTAAAWFDTDQQRSERVIYDCFMKAVEHGNENALCPWAPCVTDWKSLNKLPLEERYAQLEAHKRMQHMGEVMFSALDYKDGPTIAEAMQLILSVARSSDESTRSQAMRLLERMADAYAKHNS